MAPVTFCLDRSPALFSPSYHHWTIAREKSEREGKDPMELAESIINTSLPTLFKQNSFAFKVQITVQPYSFTYSHINSAMKATLCNKQSLFVLEQTWTNRVVNQISTLVSDLSTCLSQVQLRIKRSKSWSPSPMRRVTLSSRPKDAMKHPGLSYV